VLDRAGGEVKTACLMGIKGLEAPAARARLSSLDGHLRRALED
jgi:N-acetylmuramic acid 6-phosphate (MurNAc-6-P) etherase